MEKGISSPLQPLVEPAEQPVGPNGVFSQGLQEDATSGQMSGQFGFTKVDLSELRAAQIAELYRQGFALVLLSITAWILVFALWPAVSHEGIIGWAASLSLFSAYRYILIYRFRKANPWGDAAIPWGRTFLVLAAIGSLLWAVVPVLFFPAQQPFLQALLGFVLAGIVVGQVFAYASSRVAMFPPIIIIAGAFCGRLCYEGDRDQTIMAILTLVFACYFVIVANAIHKRFNESIKRRLEKNKFIDFLRKEKAAAEKLNTELQQQIEERRILEETYRTLVELSPVPIHINCNGNIVFVNSASAGAMGARSTDELIGRSLRDFLDPSLWELAEQRTKWMLEEWKPAPAIEMSGVRADGTPGWGQIYSAPIMYKGQPSIMVMALDVTERKLAEDRVRASLAEKEILLREIHHRVKNNMQIMASLLELQAFRLNDKSLREIFKDAQSRIWSMALVHESLYCSPDLGRIMADEYFGRLVQQITGSFSHGLSSIAVNLDVKNIPLKIDCAINCGLIVNELLSNSFKHAFPDGRKGEIKLSIRSTEENLIELEVADNGIGSVAKPDIEKPGSFGLYLVNMLVEELEAKVEINGVNGTHYLIRFTGGV